MSNDGDYKWNKTKMAEVMGLQHTNYTGKAIPAKVTGQPRKCILNCLQNISEGDQLTVLCTFLGIPTKNE